MFQGLYIEVDVGRSMEERHRIEIDNPKHTLHRFININPKLSSIEGERFKMIMYKLIEEPF